MAEGNMNLITQIKEQNFNWQLLKKLKWKWRQREFPVYSFRFMLLNLCEILSEIVLLHFLEQCEQEAYPQQNMVWNGMYLQSVNMI